MFLLRSKTPKPMDYHTQKKSTVKNAKRKTMKMKELMI